MTKRSTTASSNFTARRLFGVPTPDVLEFVEFLDRSRCERERQHDAEARCALGGYVVARLVASWIELESSSDREALSWQSEAVHRHVNDLPQDRAEVDHLQGILRALTGRRDFTDLRTALEAFSYFLDHERRAPEALAILPLVTRIHGDPLSPATFTGLALRAGSLYRQRGAWDRSHSAYTAAEEAARCDGDLPRSLRAILGQAWALHGRAEAAGAQAVVERVLAAATGSELEDIRSDAYALMSTLLRVQGHPLPGIEAAYQAARLAKPPLDRWDRLLGLGTALADQGYSTAARMVFQAVLASESGSCNNRAHVGLMRLATAAGDRLAFERHRSAVSDAGLLTSWTPEMAVGYQFHLGLGLARFRQFARARAAWTDALALAREHGVAQWRLRLEVWLERDPADDQPDNPVVPPEEVPPVIAEITAWLMG